MPANPAHVGPYRCGRGQPLLLIAGPCVLERDELALRIATRLAEIASTRPIQLVFKASFSVGMANNIAELNIVGYGLN